VRIVKPLRLSLLHRTFENAGQPMLTVTAFVGFRLDEPKAIQHEVALWKAVGKTMPDSVLDELMPKTRGELIVAGSAFVTGPPRAGTTVRVSMTRGEGEQKKMLLAKELVVFGDRTWSTFGISAPAPFREMPITWDRAFGGEGYADNPKGRGLKAVEVEGKKVHLLPNIEQRPHLLTQPSDKPPPAGFLPLDITSRERMKRVGTYDQKWLETRFPYYPEDFDWEFFNVAPPDQRLTGFFDGTERLRVEGMHPEREVVEVELPPAAARAFVERKSAPGELAEVGLKIDTVFVFPSMLIGVLAFRGTIPIEQDDADDIKTLVGGIDDRAALRDAAHFLRIKNLREDKQAFHAEILDDSPLVPPWFVEPTMLEEGWNDVAEHIQMELHVMKRGEASLDHHMADVKQKLVSTGLTEQEAEARLPKIDLRGGEGVPTTLGELPAALQRAKEDIDKTTVELEQLQAEQEDKMRAFLAEHGRDYDAEKKQSLVEAAGPPKRSIVQEFDKMRRELDNAEAQGADVSEQRAELDKVGRERLLELDEMQVMGYRMFGHQMPERPPMLSAEESAERVAQARRMRAAGESLSGYDFTGADLSGVDLSGADLSKALFECAVFRGAKLTGANLSGAMLGRAALDGGDFSATDCTGTNLARSTFEGAIFDGARFERSDFFESHLAGGSCKGARFDTLTFLKTVFGRVDFAGADFKMTSIVEADLGRSSFAGAKTDQLTFIKVVLDEVDFGASALTRTSFIQSSGSAPSFEGATLDRIAFVDGCRLERAVFRSATMKHVCFRGGAFPSADFTDASAEECDFSSSDLRQAKLYRLRAPRSLFIRTDLSGADMKSAVLMNALMMKAIICGTDFRGANLFRADLSKVRGDKATNFKDAYLKQIAVAGSLGEAHARAPRPEGMR